MLMTVNDGFKVMAIQINVKRKMNGQSRMDNQEWTIHTHNQLSKRYKQNKKKHTQKTKKLSSMDNKEKPEVKPGNRKK